MSGPGNAIYTGEVVHRRYAPRLHQLRYRVFNMFVDVDDLPALSRRLRFFSFNRFNLLSIHDADHGAGQGATISDNAWSLMRNAPGGAEISRIFMFCYPRVLGYVFNPLTVYYGYDRAGSLRTLACEVNNTFGGRHTYVLPVSEGEQLSAAKAFHVSPFNTVRGTYRFVAPPPGERIAFGVTLTDNDAPLLKAYVSGMRRPCDDRQLLRCFAGFPLLTLKVVAAIHWEALRLWLKGLRLQPSTHAAGTPAAAPENFPT